MILPNPFRRSVAGRQTLQAISIAGIWMLVGGLTNTTEAQSDVTVTTKMSGPTVTITPRRIVFEGRSRSAEVTLFNRGESVAVYRLSFVQARMTESGNLETIEVAGPEDRPADPYIRYAPRQVHLEPNSPQTVRLFLRKPPDLESGEYRSHLLFRSIPEAAGTNIEEAIAARGESSVVPRLVAIPALVIPVIFRHGDVSVRLSLAAGAFHPGTLPTVSAVPQPNPRDRGLSVPGTEPPKISFDLYREGNRSAYFDANFHFSSDRDGSVTPVGVVRGLAIYVPNEKLHLRLPLHPPKDLNLSQGILRVALTAQAGMDGEQIAAGTVLAEGEIAIP